MKRRESTGIADLMPVRIREILLVSTLYDSFILEEDGTFSDKIYREYMELQLTSPPRLTRASCGREALDRLRERHFDLVITMARIADMTTEQFARQAKELRPDLPVVMLTYNEIPISHRQRVTEITAIDQVFVWKGDSSLLLALVKTIEDELNVAFDTAVGMVRVIILVEDSPSDYSSFLTVTFNEVMKQTQAIVADGLNYMDRLHRIRARPKILLARTYEDGVSLYKRFKKYLLGVISDAGFPREGKMDPAAGIQLVQEIREQMPALPILLQSADPDIRERIGSLDVEFSDKNSPDLLANLRQFILHNFGFGDFVFIDRQGNEVDRATSLFEMKVAVLRVPDESLRLHAERHHFSNWLMSRGEFPLALEFKPRNVSDYQTPDELRTYLAEAFSAFLEHKQRGRITEFSRTSLHQARDFVRLGGGSLGGKGRGIAFMYTLLSRSQLHQLFPEVKVLVPRTVVICTDEFDRFMTDNRLHEKVGEDMSDEAVIKLFLNAKLSKSICKDLEAILDDMRYPLAVRSSSLLEDSQFQPFAGLYATYMLPNNDDSVRVRLRQLRQAIKLIYASTYLSGPKAYMHAIGQRVEEEKMAVLIQRLIGEQRDSRFYPTFAGTAQSYNYYPLRYMLPDDGIAVVALGLGRTVAEGRKALRFSPMHPHVLPQMSTPEQALRSTQRQFFALDMSRPRVKLTSDEEGTLVLSDLETAENDATLASVGATYCPQDQRIHDTIYRKGVRIVNFAPVLKYDTFPLSELLSETLSIGKQGMGGAVEVEFAVNLKADDDGFDEFAVLQLRPLVTSDVDPESDIESAEPDRVVLRSERTLGNGVIGGIRDVVYVPPTDLDAQATVKMAEEVALINATLVAAGRPYALIGPGRWGTADRFLGIPVSWMQVSAARIIVELGMEGFDVDPSQGTHFFHNITSLRIGYMTVDGRRDNEQIDWAWLNEQKMVNHMTYVRHVTFENALEARLDGRSGIGVILKSPSP